MYLEQIKKEAKKTLKSDKFWDEVMLPLLEQVSELEHVNNRHARIHNMSALGEARFPIYFKGLNSMMSEDNGEFTHIGSTTDLENTWSLDTNMRMSLERHNPIYLTVIFSKGYARFDENLADRIIVVGTHLLNFMDNCHLGSPDHFEEIKELVRKRLNEIE